MDPVLISIVIVSYNTQDLLRRCLESLVRNPLHSVVSPADGLAMPCMETASDNFSANKASGPPVTCEIIVVDNASPDCSADMVASEFPQVRLIRAGANLGFARATNVGLEASRGKLLLLLNPDTEVLGRAMPAMAVYLDGHPKVGVVSPALVYPDGRPQHAAFHFPTLW
ncbi:MAG TPA: glycosyltransferase, partial [Chloroflexota bacterium]|nr:glycosyltransferase [Chloroflexota bacterium]